MYAPLLKILFTMLVMHAVSTGLRFTVTLDAIAHGGTSREVSLMLAGVALVPAFFAISAGRWLDRAGPGKPLALAIAVAVGAGALTLSFPSAVVGLWPLFAACILVGLGFMLANTITQRLTGDVLPPEKRSMGFTAVSIITAASGLVTPVLAGYAIEWRGHAAFYAFAMTAPLILALLAFSPLMRNVFGRVRKRTEKKAADTKGAAKEILADKPMRTVLISSVLISVAWEVGNLMMPIYCASVGLTPSETGWVLGSFSAASFVVRFLMPGLMRLFSEWRLISFTFPIAMGALGSVIGAGATLGALGVFTGCGFLFALQSRAAVEAASAERM